MNRVRAGAALALTGRYALFGRQAAAGLRAWADHRGVDLRIEDDRSDAERSARLCAGLAPTVDLLFGPYGSGAGRAVAVVMAGRPEVVWNHGAAALPGRRGRMVDVLGPAASYWRGLPAVLAPPGAPPPRVALIRAPGGFGAEVAAGAAAALASARIAPAVLRDLEAGGADAAVGAAVGAGAEWIVGGGRLEDDLELGRAAAVAGLGAALVVCGVDEAGRALGDAVVGWLGPVQWDGTPGPVPLPAGCDYPAAQALAAALIAEEAAAHAGSTAPADLWDAARALRTTTLIGRFAVDGEGRQTAHAPAIVRWESGPRGLVRTVAWSPRGGA